MGQPEPSAAPNFDGCDSRWIAFNVGFLCRNIGGMNRSFGSSTCD